MGNNRTYGKKIETKFKFKEDYKLYWIMEQGRLRARVLNILQLIRRELGKT
jgi:hypothetical protein